MGVNSCGTTLIDEGTFKNIGAITWDTTVKTSGFTAVSGNGYFCNTTSSAFTVTLPSSPSAGDVVAIADYANTFDTNNVTRARNGSNIQGSAADFQASIEGLSITLIYVDGTQGWLSVDAAQASNISAPQFLEATGGTITESGDFKIHTFTGPGTFCVSNAGNPSGSDAVDYLVVAGGGGGGGSKENHQAGGGGAGGYRNSYNCETSGGGSSSELSFPISVQGYPITVGGGGAAGAVGTTSGCSDGSDSVFSSIPSTGGGGGGVARDNGEFRNASPGGSGGGGGSSDQTPIGQGGTGTLNQGFAGANAIQPGNRGGSGGGAGGVGGNAAVPYATNPGPGGAGLASSITGTPVTRAVGGALQQDATNVPGGANTGTGGSGGKGTPGVPNGGGAGGSGIVIIRYKFQ